MAAVRTVAANAFQIKSSPLALSLNPPDQSVDSTKEVSQSEVYGIKPTA